MTHVGFNMEEEEILLHLNIHFAHQLLSDSRVNIISNFSSGITAKALSSGDVSPRTVISINCAARGVQTTLEDIFGPSNPVITSLLRVVLPRNCEVLQLTPAWHPLLKTHHGWYKALRGICFILHLFYITFQLQSSYIFSPWL
jgi:hypothetical protein